MKILAQGVISVAVIGIAVGGWYVYRGGDDTPNRSGTAAAVGRVGPGTGGPGATRGPAGPRGRGARPVGIVAAPVETGVISDTIESVGTALANEAIIVTAKQAGTIVRINFREGQKVAAGTPLVEFDATERQADLDTAIAMRDETRQRLNRAMRMRSDTVSQARIDELKSQTRAAEARVSAAQARLRDNVITAPFVGRVGLRQVSPGALVQPGTVVTTLDDVSVIKVEFSVPETALGRLRPGLVVTVRTAALPGRVFEGRVSVIDTRIDPVTRSVRVHAVFDNADESLRPGLFLNVALSLETRQNAILVPEEAVVANGTEQFVFRVADGKAVRTKVTLGRRLPGKVEALSGVAPGDQVVVRGVQKVRDGQPVTSPGTGDRRGPDGRPRGDGGESPRSATGRPAT